MRSAAASAAPLVPAIKGGAILRRCQQLRPYPPGAADVLATEPMTSNLIGSVADDL